MWKDISSKREEDIVEKIAETLAKYDMEVPGLLALWTIRPLSNVGANLFRLLFGVYLPTSSNDYLAVFENRENVDKIIKRVEELHDQKKKKSSKARIARKLSERLPGKSETDNRE